MTVDFGNKFKRSIKGAPLIRPVDGGDLVEYVRCSSFGAPLDDHYFLERWKQRITAKGAVTDLELMGRLITTPADATKVLDLLARNAFKAGGGTVAADYGTEFHAWMEKLILHRCQLADIPDEFRANCQAAHDVLTAAGFDLEDCIVEPNIVNDKLRAAGSCDLAPMHPATGRRIIIDYKTGSDPNKLSYGVQYCAYAGGVLYDTVTETRTPVDFDQELAFTLHVRNGKARLIAVDLTKVQPVAELCAAIYQARELDGWYSKFSSDLLSTSASAADVVPETSAAEGSPLRPSAAPSTRSQQLAAIPTDPDDGPVLDESAFAGLRAMQATLNDTQKAWMRQRVEESMHACLSLHTTAGFTTRRLHAIHTILTCALQIGARTADDVTSALRNAIADVLEQDWPRWEHVPVGHALAALGHTQVEVIAQTVTVLDDNGWRTLAAA